MSKYYLCEFLECNGEFEYNHHHVYSDKFLNKLGMKKINNEENNDVEKKQVKLLNLFFANIKVEEDTDGSEVYSTFERQVSYQGLQEIKQSELKTLEKGHIYCD